jgi:hypothetical protein
MSLTAGKMIYGTSSIVNVPRVTRVDASAVMSPIPAEVWRPIKHKYKPIPAPVAILILTGISLARYCRIPNTDMNRKIRPFTKWQYVRS